jgi:hypothetical protein
VTRVSVEARSGAIRFGAASWVESIERADSVAGAPPGRRGQISSQMVQMRGTDRRLNSLLEGDSLPDAILSHGRGVRRLSRGESGQKHEGRKDDRRCERLP